jgi:microsomal dipeptidase-like Zn-dependent dipeptidase
LTVVVVVGQAYRRAMIADLHIHYPRRVVEAVETGTAAEAIEGVLIRTVGRVLSDPDPHAGYRVTVEGLRAGGVGVALSVLYRPLQEMDLGKPYAAPPDARYFPLLLRDLERVEAEVAGHDPARIRMARDADALQEAVAAGATAVVHCVEGGFHLGDTAAHIAANVAELARRGVAYITVAHLFFRQVAANAPALPFLESDARYDELFPQPPGVGLTALGEAAVRAMMAHGILVDLSHMRTDAVTETLDLMDMVDPDRAVPVISSHAGYRFGHQDYMLTEPMLERIRDRGGVVGLILAQHQLNDGLFAGRTSTFGQTKDIIFRHVDKIAQVTGGYDHLAIGSDFDGFIKPTATGLETAADLRRLEEALRERYRDEDVDKIVSGNVLRVLGAGWGRPR